MKKLFFIAILCVAAITANAQDKKWNIGFGLGYASPASDLKTFADGGIDGYLNCTYNVAPKLGVGAEYNGASLVGVSLGGADLKASKVNSYMLKGVYYLTESSVRPYASLKLGLYNTKLGVFSMDEDLNGDLTVSSDYITKTTFGEAFEIGLKLKWFNIGVAYNNIGKVEEAKLSMWQYNIGFNIGF